MSLVHSRSDIPRKICEGVQKFMTSFIINLFSSINFAGYLATAMLVYTSPSILTHQISITGTIYLNTLSENRLVFLTGL